jgi:hypothetical protein
VYHDTDPEDDGYFAVYDEYKERYIFVCSRQVGRTRAFNEEFEIMSYLDLMGPKDIEAASLEEYERITYANVIKAMISQMANTEGNISVYCFNGRSRSPAFVAAYFVAVGCYSAARAYMIICQFSF